MASYLKGAATPRVTPQSEPIPGREADMARNSAGGYAFTVTPLERLRRFLILGSEGGTYYASERDLTKDNLKAVRATINTLGVEAVEVVASVSESGRAPKNDPAIYALSIAAAHKDPAVRLAAFVALPRVCRTGTHLYHFVDFVEGERGWGRGLRRAVSEWYRQPVAKVAYQAVKYRSRDGWAHRDLLRLAHPKPQDSTQDSLYKFIVYDTLHMQILNARIADGDTRPVDDPLAAIDAYLRAQAAQTPGDTSALIAEYGGKLPREALRTEHLTDPDVNRALLEQGMPMTALIRNLANLTRYGVLQSMGTHTRMVCEQITDTERLRKARVHPIQVIAALMTYQAGVSARGGNTWTPIREVVDALDEAFYAAFGNVEPSGKPMQLSLDVSGSMTCGQIAGIPGMTPAVGAAVMAMVQARSGDPYIVFGFGDRYFELDISPKMRLDSVVRRTAKLNFGGTDCSLPMIVATENLSKYAMPPELFLTITDSETWAGRVQPIQALRAYRERSGVDAKMVTMGMTSTGFSIGDPNDRGCLDVVGFDTNAPNVISAFMRGEL